MTVQTRYQGFLDESARRLSAEGARVLATSADSDRTRLQGWDLVLAVDGPGVGRVYGFTDVDGVEQSAIADRVTRLATVLASSTSGLPALEVVAVLTSSGQVEGSKLRALARISPTVYYQGLRPSTWLVDLSRGTVSGGSRLRRPEGIEVLEAAVRGDPARTSEPIPSAEEGGRQLNAFYTLMRGRQPYVTYGLIAVNVAMFVILAVKAGVPALLYQNAGPSAATMRDLGAMSPALVEHGQWWRLFTAIFLHASVPHILFNMVSLLAVGTLAERLYGSFRFLAIYLGAGLIGSVASVLYGAATGNVDGLAVGASGAIFGVAGALVTVRYQRSNVIPARLRRRISSSILPLVIISLVFAALTPYVDNSAHIGGLLGGMALSFAFPLTRSTSEAV